MAIYLRIPAAYEALKSFNILQLPCQSTLKAYTGAFMHDPGARSDCIVDQVSHYVTFKEHFLKSGKQEPKADGVLIFDEVKVACQLLWNSRNNALMGLAMSSKDQASLTDVYKALKDPDSSKQTSYILQFLWRDLTSDYDIVGPYFTSSSTVDAKFVTSCVLETIKLFQFHGFKTSLLVCDGASSNISAVKASHGFHGAYSINEQLDDKYMIKPWMINPYNPPHKLFWLICLSHQVCDNGVTYIAS